MRINYFYQVRVVVLFVLGYCRNKFFMLLRRLGHYLSNYIFIVGLRGEDRLDGGVREWKCEMFGIVRGRAHGVLAVK